MGLWHVYGFFAMVYGYELWAIGFGFLFYGFISLWDSEFLDLWAMGKWFNEFMGLSYEQPMRSMICRLIYDGLCNGVMANGYR